MVCTTIWRECDFSMNTKRSPNTANALPASNHYKHCNHCSRANDSQFKRCDGCREIGRRHRQSERGRATAKRYRKSEAYRSTNRRYNNSYKGLVRTWVYNHSGKGRARNWRYSHSDVGRATASHYRDRRRWSQDPMGEIKKQTASYINRLRNAVR